MHRPRDILLVEDNPADVDLTFEAFEQGGVEGDLHVVGDGVEAIRFLRQQEEYASAPRPTLILLDLNLPKRDGRSVLAEVKADHGLRQIPVVVLSSSAAADDVERSYELHANCYIQKPSSFSRYVSIIQALDEFWFQVATCPPKLVLS
ncbi:MAG: response regulator [Haliangiales bacterium]